jgi:ankyrin repeat protein
MWASRNGLKEIVQLLLKHECINVNQQNNDGRTALMLASFVGHKEIIEMLLKHKDIQTTQQDEKGFSALRWAIERGHKEIAKILEGKVKRKNQHKQSPAILSSC